MTTDVACVFCDALPGVKALHDQGWLHGDLKPPNLSIIGTLRRAVLLDIGHAVHLKPDSTLRPTPGCGGTFYTRPSDPLL